MGANPLAAGPADVAATPDQLERDARQARADNWARNVQRLAAPRYRALAAEERNPLLRALKECSEQIEKQYSILSTVVASNWWHLGMAGKLPEFLCPPECVGQQDFVGLDYYWGISTLADQSHSGTDRGRAGPL